MSIQEMINMTNWQALLPDVPSISFDVTWLGIYVSSYLLAALLLYTWLSSRRRNRSAISDGKRILLVIAHPDDECMFFGPTIVTLTEKEPRRVFILCVSNGDYDGEGGERASELLVSCLRLGVQSSNLTLLDNDFLPDNPKVPWDISRLASIILNHVKTLDIDRVITFDDDGVSGHGNHTAIYRACLRLVGLRLLPVNCRIFALDTVGLFRKYSGLFDVIPAAVGHDGLFVISLSSRKKVLHAMHAHHSQLLWFRRLYLIASRYMFINAYTEVTDDFYLCFE